MAEKSTSNQIAVNLDGTGSQESTLSTRKDILPSYYSLPDLETRFEFDLNGGNHQLKHFIPPDKHITLLNPTSENLTELLAKIKEPSVLCIRGCDLFFDAPFHKFKTLLALEISGTPNSYPLFQLDVSQMAQLQTLNLSHLPIQELQSNFFHGLTDLRSLVLSCCSSLQSIPETSSMCLLECLDLSHLLIEALPDGLFGSLLKLRRLILRGCSKLRCLPSTETLMNLEVLDLSHCTSLQEMKCSQFHHERLEILDLSYSALTEIPQIRSDCLLHLIIRDSKLLNVLHSIINVAQTVRVLDLCGAQNLVILDGWLQYFTHLEILDLSRTGIQSIVCFPSSYRFSKLILRECTQLLKLPAVMNMSSLEVLDISGCEILTDLPEYLCYYTNLKELNLSGCTCLKELSEGLFDRMSRLEKLDLSKTKFTHLPSFANLTNLQTLSLSQTPVQEVPSLSNLVSLKEFVPPTSLKEIGCASSGVYSASQGKVSSHPNEFHLISTFTNNSAFDRFNDKFQRLSTMISDIEKSIEPSEKINLRRTNAELKYIQANIDRLEISGNCSSSKELLLELVNVADNLSVSDFLLHDPTNLRELVRLVTKLKLFIPPPQKVDNDKEKRKKKSRFVRVNREEEEEQAQPSGFDAGMRPSFETLTEVERNCLLYFAVFPSRNVELLSVNKRMLFQLWYGEGFINQRTYLSCSERRSYPRWHFEDEDMCKCDYGNSVSGNGQKIMEVLHIKGFIASISDGVCSMDREAHGFVREQAKQSGFFDFDEGNGTLTQRLSGRSQRALLLKPRDKIPSSCKLWVSYTNSCKKIHTLLYVNEDDIDIRTEWLSNMSNLRVLHLARLSSNSEQEKEEQIGIVDLKFLEVLKNMKHLRLLSLEGFAALTKLPDSACKMTNLRTLILRYCTNLEELPAGIGSLRKLTHLDLTECHVLSELPKGLTLLTNLEVLKGFVITYIAGGPQHAKSCTLNELLKLGKLRKLNLVVNKDEFPSIDDLDVFENMENLCNLKITWTKSYHQVDKEKGEQSHRVGLLELEALMRLVWKNLKFKCWIKEPYARYPTFGHIGKLVLCCYPFETAPDWLNQAKLWKLERLYVIGGNLKTWLGHTNRSRREYWSTIKRLRLNYLPNLEDHPATLMHKFPNAKIRVNNCDVDELDLYRYRLEEECRHSAH